MITIRRRDERVGANYGWLNTKIKVGNVCRDFDATEVIWEFFKAQPKR